jgi:nucleotide-binding universal stress UspA family protein
MGNGMRAILAVLWNDNEADPLLDLAITVASRFDAHLVGLYVRPAAENFIPSGDFGLALSQDYLERLTHESATKAARLRSRFESVVGREGGAGGGKISAEWLEAEGSAAVHIGSIGRVYDLILVSRPDAKGSAESEILLEAALFETGRPVLVAPPVLPASFGTKALVAWNGSTESSLTLALGLPLLQQAQEVHVLSVEGAIVPGPGAAEVARYLGYHGISAKARHIETPSPGTAAGEVFLAEAMRLGCDLMLKGAYTQSRLRQMIFGGATRHIINSATLPVLMAH